MIHCDSTYVKFKNRPNRSLVMAGRVKAASVVAWEGARGTCCGEAVSSTPCRLHRRTQCTNGSSLCVSLCADYTCV